MEPLDVMLEYFASERALGWSLVPVGLLLLVFAVAIGRMGGSLALGLAIPLAIAGVAGMGGGAFLAKHTDKQVAELRALHAESPAKLAAVEKPRMAKVNGNWIVLKSIYAALLVAALIVVFGVKKEWVVGVALALMLLSSIAMIIDVFAEARAEVYAGALERIDS